LGDFLNEFTKVKFTNLEKVIFPELKITKEKVIEYYIRIAPKMLKLLRDRPLSLKRFPDGVEREGFFEKDAPMGTPPWVKTFRKFSETAERDVNYIVCNDLDTLIWMANLAAVEIHMPLSRIEKIEMPDFALFDIDPEPPLSFNDTMNVALLIKEQLDARGLVSYVKTSGKKGLHVLVPVAEGYTFKETREFVHEMGRRLSKESSTIVSELPQSRDRGTIFIDYLQNSHGRTMASPYSLRATPQATVSTPLAWDDLKKGIRPEDFTIFNVPKLAHPWEGLLASRQKLELN
jgi:bifunctional non-homologous end joining protein LigD